MIQERIERQASNLMISINNSFGQSEEAIFKNQKGSKKTDYPSSLSSQLYFTADALTEPLNIANTVRMKIHCKMPLRNVIFQRYQAGYSRIFSIIFIGTEFRLQYVRLWSDKFEINVQRSPGNPIRRHQKINGMSC